MELSEPVEMICVMRRMERRFKRVCRQLVLMNNNIRVVKSRYERAVKAGQGARHYNLRLRILTLEGVRNMFWEYAQERADVLDALEEDLKNYHDIDWEDVNDEAMEEEMEDDL